MIGDALEYVPKVQVWIDCIQAAGADQAIESRCGLATGRAQGTVLSEPAHPNDLWCADYKGEFMLADKRYCYPLTITDSASRYLLCCEALETTKEIYTFTVFERVFKDFGLPQNGRHERVHLTLKKEATRPAGKNFLHQHSKFDDFMQEYNRERPHQALGMKYPAELYSPSLRLYRGLTEPEYPFHDRTVLVTHCGASASASARSSSAMSSPASGSASAGSRRRSCRFILP